MKLMLMYGEKWTNNGQYSLSSYYKFLNNGDLMFVLRIKLVRKWSKNKIIRSNCLGIYWVQI